MPYNTNYYDKKFNSALDDQGNVGRQANTNYMNAFSQFDPSAYAKQAAEGAYGSFRTQMNQDLGDLRGKEVGMGRLNTGFGTQDEDRLYTAGVNNLNNQLSQQAVQAAQIRAGQISDMGNYSQGYNNRYLDALGGRLNTLSQQDIQNAASKRAMWGNLIGGALGSAAHFIPGFH